MLLCLRRLPLCSCAEAGGQAIEPMMCLFELPVDEADASNERSDVGAGRFGRSRRDFERRPTQYIEHTGASNRRMRWRLRSLAIVGSRMRAALSGVGTVSQRSSNHSAPRSLSSSSSAGK